VIGSVLVGVPTGGAAVRLRSGLLTLQADVSDDSLRRVGNLDFLDANKLAITVFDDYDDILAKTCHAWNFFANDPDRIAY
jgi:hypothetical protein